jgi:putative salt-induced outer membrane protein
MSPRNIFAIALILFAIPSFAAEEDSSRWSGKVYLGYLATSGNSETSSLDAGFEVGYTAGKWLHVLDGQAINSTEDNVTSAESYDVGFKSERNLTEPNFLFGQVRWRENRFSGYDTQVSEVAGYGRRLIDLEAHKLNAEIGVGARQSKLQDGTDESKTIISGAFDYTWEFSESAKFTQKFNIEHGTENTYMDSVTAISAGLSGTLALVASYTIKSNTDVPALTEKTDTYTALSLEYAF